MHGLGNKPVSFLPKITACSTFSAPPPPPPAPPTVTAWSDCLSQFHHFISASHPSDGVHVLLPRTCSPPSHTCTRTHTHMHTYAYPQSPARPQCHFLWETSPNAPPSSYGKQCSIECSAFLSVQACSCHTSEIARLFPVPRWCSDVFLAKWNPNYGGRWPHLGEVVAGSRPGIRGPLLCELGVVAGRLPLEEPNVGGLE